MSSNVIRAVDLFCGSGGTSTGLVRACERLGRRIELTAVNHWAVAIETHSANHPWARHEHARIDQLDPRAVAPKGRIDLLVASPECTHFSRARGKAPKNDQSRASGWDVLRWVERLCPRDVILENVTEWEDWGPVNAATGQPIEGRKGETFRAFVAVLESLGYRVEWRRLNAADYGEATTRERLFLRARRGRQAPVWPMPTHTETPGGMFDLGRPWRPAREIIDWAYPSPSIFGRRHPLKPKTLARIERGIREFWGEYATPFLVLLRGTSSVRSIEQPVPTLTAGGGHVGLVDPFVVHTTHGGRTHGLDRPLPTVTGANRGELALIVPQFGEARALPVGRPLGTLTTTSRGCGLVEAFLLSQASGGAPRPVSSPTPTFVTKGAVSLVEPFLVSYYGNGGASPTRDPVPTVTARDRFGLVEPASLDIRFRMLQPHELAAAMGFPAGYRFAGNRGDQVRQIGNAVCVSVADALVTAALTEVA